MLPELPVDPSRPDSDVGPEGDGEPGNIESGGEPAEPAVDDTAADDAAADDAAADDAVIDLTDSRWGRGSEHDEADQRPRWGRRWRPRARR